MNITLLKYSIGLCLMVMLPLNLIAQERVEGDIMVQTQGEVDIHHLAENFQAKYPETNLRVTKQLSKSWNIWLLHTDLEEDSKVLNLLQTNPDIVIAQFNHIAQLRDTFPNDTFYVEQWAMKNTGQSNGVPGADIEAERAWDHTTGGVTANGDTIVVAVIDGGVDLAHEDLDLWKNRAEIPNNSIDDDLNGYIDDYDGWNAGASNGVILTNSHGTHVTGIVGAKGNNITGVTGVSWQVKVLPIALINYTEAEVVEAYSYVFDMRRQYEMTGGIEGAFIVATNSSFGVDLGQPQDYPLWCAMYDSLGQLGILNAAAVLNSDVNVDVKGDIPTACASDYLITVTSTTRLDGKPTNCGYGRTTVDLGAPGVGIRSTNPGNTYGLRSGTSEASPHVAGAIALFYSAACPDFLSAYRNNPDSVSLLVKDYILKGAETIDDLEEITVSGGRLNIWNALNRFVNEQCINCLEVSTTVLDISCYQGNNGAIIATPSAGITPYVYEWSTGDTTNQAFGLEEGSYYVMVTDSVGCERYQYVDLEDPERIVITLDIDSATDNNANGAIIAVVTGGTPPYTYLWDDLLNSTTASITNQPPGTYSLTITDFNGCTAFSAGVVGQIFTGIQQVVEPSISLYPNPGTGLFHFTLKNSYATASTVRITDIFGTSIYQQSLPVGVQQHSIDLSDYPSGVYLFHWQDEQGHAITKKIMVL